MSYSSRSAQSGHTLVELIVVAAIVSVLAATAIPALTKALSRAALRAAAVRVQSLLRVTRDEAITLKTNRGIRFTREGTRWVWAVYADGDGDGVLNADIAKGIDPLVSGPNDLGAFRGVASLGIPAGGVRHPDDGSWIPDTAPAVRFGTSSVCSFAQDGSSTPGTVYLCTTDGEAAMVRTSGDGGRIRVLFYDRGEEEWVMK